MKQFAVFSLAAFAAVGFSQSFSNPTAIDIPSGQPGVTIGPSTPSSIVVSGITDPITSITVDLFGLSHTFPDDIDVLLVGPTGAHVMLMSDAGLNFVLNGVNLKFDDAAPNSLPDSTLISSGSFKPTNFGVTDSFTGAGAPGGTGPWGTALTPFYSLNANGTWTLFVQDDASQDVGQFAGGWQINFRTEAVPEPATMAVLGLGALALIRKRRK